MDLRIAQRSHVIENADELVLQTARIPTRERARDDGPAEQLILHRGAMRGVGAGFVAEHQRRADLRGHRSPVQDRGDVLRRAQAPRRDDRDIVRPADPGDQLVQRLGARVHVRCERPAVPAGIRALDHQAVRTGSDGHPCLVGRCHRDHDQHSERAQPRNHIR